MKNKNEISKRQTKAKEKHKKSRQQVLTKRPAQKISPTVSARENHGDQSSLAGARVILPCSGQTVRWGNYLDVPKHLVLIDGIPILKRTVNQLRNVGFTEILITSFNEKYETEGATLVVPEYNFLPGTGIGHSEPFWSKTGRTIVLFGDVYYSDEAMKVIAHSDPSGIKWFGRMGPGKSGCPYGELFGLSIPLENQDELRKSILFIIQEKEKGRISRTTSWECYRFLHGYDLNKHIIGPDFYDINDETEDFDYPQEYEMWLNRFRPDQAGASLPKTEITSMWK
jgi:hypothetical protein